MSNPSKWREMYEGGMTYEQIALDEHVRPESVRLVVKALGGVSRPPSSAGNKGPHASRMTDGVKGKQEGVLPQIKTGSQSLGHRRRGQL